MTLSFQGTSLLQLRTYIFDLHPLSLTYMGQCRQEGGSICQRREIHSLSEERFIRTGDKKLFFYEVAVILDMHTKQRSNIWNLE